MMPNTYSSYPQYNNNNGYQGGRKKIPDYKCPHCPVKYLSESDVQNHITRVHMDGNGQTPPIPPPEPYQPRRRSSTFNCTQCIKKYLSQDGLDAHIKKEHQPVEEEANEDGLSWPPEKGSIIATLF